MSLRSLWQVFQPVCVVLLVACVIAASTVGSAHAVDRNLTIPDVPVLEQSNERAVRDRLTFIEHEMADNNLYSKVWWSGWTTIFAGAALYHAAVVWAKNVPGRDGDDRIFYNEKRQLNDTQLDFTIGLATTILGLGGMFVFPYPQRYALKKIRALPEQTHQERVQKLLRAEELLMASAEADVRGKAWNNFLITVLVTASSGTAVWLTTQDHSKAIPRMVLGSSVGITKILSQSRQSLRSWQRYAEVFGGGLSSAGVPTSFDGLELLPPQPKPEFALTPMRNGLGLGVTF